MDQVYTLKASQFLRKRDDFFYIWKLERKENEEIKGRISRRSLVLFPIIQQICTKSQNHRCNSSWEIFDTNFPMYYIRVRDGKKEKEGKINLPVSSFVFCPTIYLATLNVTKFEDSGPHRRGSGLGGGGGGVWNSLFSKNLAHYSLSLKFLLIL